MLGISIYKNPKEFKSLLNVNLASDNKVEVEKEINIEELLQNKEITVDPCDLSGDRKKNVKVDVGMDTDYSSREYWGYTNEYSQLVYVKADEIIAQDDNEEETEEKGGGRYCSDEAKVKGVEATNLDEGHIIADSLGGVSNAYNITPQESQLNRYGTQADLEEEMREALSAGKEVTDFEGFVYYKTTNDTIPISYKISYKIDKKEKIYIFENK